MAKATINQWKTEQREQLRAAFGPAFVRYTEMVHKVDEPDDYRKYLEFIARQVGLEEQIPKTSPHDGLTTVHINIGQFHQSARAVNGAPFSVIPSADVVDATPIAGVVHAPPVDTLPVALPDPSGHYDPSLASLMACDVLEPAIADNDFDGLLDHMLEIP